MTDPEQGEFKFGPKKKEEQEKPKDKAEKKNKEGKEPLPKKEKKTKKQA